MSIEKISDYKDTDDEIDLRELIITVAKGWKIILLTAVVVFIATLIYTMRLKDQFVVTTKAAVAGNNSNSQMAGIAALAGVTVGSGGEIDLLDHVDVVIKNAYFMDKILEKKWSISLPQKKSEKKARLSLKYDTLSLAEYWKVKPDTTVDDWQYIQKMNLYGMLRSTKRGHILVEKSDGILEIKTKFDNPSLTFGVHQELIRLLQEYFSNDYASKNRISRVFIQQRVSEVKGTLSSYEVQLKNLRQSNYIDLAPRIAIERARLEREITLQSQIYAELNKQLEMAKIEEKKESPVFEILQVGERPLGPSEPNRKLLIAIGLILGLALGVFLVFLKEWIKTFWVDYKTKGATTAKT